MDLNQLAEQYQNGIIDGHRLANMITNKQITKQERRKVVKLSQKLIKYNDLTDRQKKRLEVKEKKSLPKLSKEDRKRKFGIDVNEEREIEAANFTICLGCRKRGHYVKDCPQLPISTVQKETAKDSIEICFNCGSYEHTLKNCNQVRNHNGQLKFANCFICKKVGHISRDCPENPNGLYPNGGCCHICLLKTHLVRDCPNRTEEDKLKRIQLLDDTKNGIRIEGLTSKESKLKGDEIILIDNNNNSDEYQNDDEDDDNNNRKKKKKKDKKHK